MNKMVEVQRDRDVPTPGQLLDRARAMLPALRARAAEAERDCRLPMQTVEEMREAGFFRILQPKRWGGFEMAPQVFFDVQMTLAEACMSTAWVLGVVGVHPYQLALFDDRAQADVWSTSPDTLISSSYQPVGKVERVEGGFRLSGRWGFSSGCQHCDWVFLGAIVPPLNPGDPMDMRTFLLPRSDYEVVEAWDTFGLRGTGSHDVVVSNGFVPEHRTHKASDGFLCTNPGQTVNTAPLFALPWAQVFVRAVSTAAIGATQGALDAYLGIVRERVSSNTGKVSRTDPASLAAAARVRAQIDEMKVQLAANFDRLLGKVTAGEPLSLEERLMYRYQSATIVPRCAGLVDSLMPLLGGRAIYRSSPIIRFWLDVNAARAHVANDPNNVGPDLGGVLLGGAPAVHFC
ncbi:3-hydroxy-9,10-secoandrosta-1,3,5(10)-triene-9,17-dione monooxygenase [Nitrospirillum amazonense]|uniref:3-hydroxy-9,10-secoandrosta-1,3,5(10)-triene-9, 17-dione monooxygenase n=1 Tax=Nitrospirillum amazonense TaxID=28077 RepID=A0A560F9X3_9PROT|nr:acyl-CoA dehydrogenase family protein [Nitrospirillum amazonense]TWB18409.1 3-hydroxy-9,10-secoandrosta-1,3,5(10)-triene-9,17-dione monooxygenase [Nitrospirillum amazonense]TWB66070.1 3-hydroxy-9,10-secoandrosta-1,3,5(10)-triene-9,17-dione monooxygenase [Nitrospirillum amazonense]